jgi:hypothetical protein
MGWEDDYREALRELVATSGCPVLFIDKDHPFEFARVSTYGWKDYDAMEHIRFDKCSWIVESGATVIEETYSEFLDTDVPNKNSVGINVELARCACGRYTNVTLRVECSLREALQGIFKSTPLTL